MPDPRIAEAVIHAADLAGIGVTAFIPNTDGGSSVFVSERAAAIMGYSVEELRDLPPLATVAPERSEQTASLLSDWLERGLRSGVVETVLAKKNGERVPVEVAFTSIDLDGQAAAVTFIFELSQRRRAEADLRRSEARFRELVEHAPDGVGIIQDGRFVYANARATAILGFESAEALCAQPLDQLFEAGDFALMGARIRAMLTEGVHFAPYVYTCIRGDGARVRVEITSIQTEHQGRPAVLGFARDVTERTKMEAQLAQADRLVALGTLAAGVAHEINNPLTFFYLRLDALERWLSRLPEELRAEAATQLVELRGGADRVTRIVRDLRTFSRSADQPRGPVKLGDVFAFVERITASEHRHRATLTIDAGDTPPVLGEQGRLEQVFLNLVLNALQAMPNGDPSKNHVKVLARLVDGRVVVDVADNGPGMAPDIAARVFDPFFTTKPVGVGTGLGLSICHGIINQLGGEIAVESAPGVGTTFRVSLPVLGPGDVREEQRRNVLVVEDDELVARMVAKMLSERHDVVVVPDGTTAERALQSGSFDVVLCDLVMPGMSGVDLYERVLATKPELARRFVFMTGGVLTERAADFLETVSSPRVLKPFSAETLHTALGDVLR
ncbi:MAG: PAS domain S-box protein [Polyangiaceae bacterium]|nr:PAS domain S-box protein [Polyangiaceae bacterium]MCE7888846.1 PAS domain S-box protein [Sorangiineae bacterium PRO1]MCL4750198.1 PAS domain S-box protein [Myxococcales bacterium]